MTVVIKKIKKGKVRSETVIEAKPLENLIDKYKVQVGQVYLDASGASNGVVVKACHPPSDVRVQKISTMGLDGPPIMMEVETVVNVDFYLADIKGIAWVKTALKRLKEA